MRRGLSIALLFLVIGSALPARAAPIHQRLYFGESQEGYLYWTVDPTDPYLPADRVTRQCGVGDDNITPDQYQICNGGTQGGRVWQLNFYPGALIHEPVTWDQAAPLRFHFDLGVEPLTPSPYTVHLAYTDGPTNIESAAATQVSPGVYEGELTVPGMIDMSNQKRLSVFSVRVRSEERGVDLDLGLKESSWIELPRPVDASALPELVAASPTSTEHVEVGERSFEFNDDRWDVVSFGTDQPLRGAGSFEIQIPERADVIVWIDSYRGPYVDNLARGGEPEDPRALWHPQAQLKRDGVQIGSYIYEAVGAVGLAPGAVTVNVNQPLWGTDGNPYSLHALLLYGPRTLSAMEWTYANEGPAAVSGRVSGTGSCGSMLEPVPISSEVTSYRVGLEWDSSNPLSKWSPSFMSALGSTQCASPGLGKEVVLVAPGERLGYVGAAVAQDAAFFSYNDTVFDMRVDYTHTPIPIVKRVTTLALSVAKTAQGSVLTATLLAGAEPVAGRTIGFTIEGILSVAETDGAGLATLVTDHKLRNGDVVTASFAGDGLFEPAEASVVFGPRPGRS